MSEPLSKSSLVFDAAAYLAASSGGDALFQSASVDLHRLDLTVDDDDRTTTARLSRGEKPQPTTADITLEGVLTHDPAETGQITFALTAASLPQGSEAAVNCPDDTDIGIKRTKLRSGRFASVNFEASQFQKPVRLQLQFWLNGQPLLSGGSLAFEVSRLTTADDRGSGVLRDRESGLPIARLAEPPAAVVARIGQIACVLKRT